MGLPALLLAGWPGNSSAARCATREEQFRLAANLTRKQAALELGYLRREGERILGEAERLQTNGAGGVRAAHGTRHAFQRARVPRPAPDTLAVREVERPVCDR